MIAIFQRILVLGLWLVRQIYHLDCPRRARLLGRHLYKSRAEVRGDIMHITGSLPDRLAAAGVTYAPEIVSAARSHGLDPALLAAVAAQETGGPGSNGGANVVGDGGHGRGLFQIDDRWHSFARSDAAMDPSQNAQYAAGMLSGLLKRYGGDVHKALSAYNSGSPNAAGTPTTWRDGRTLSYADSVLRHYGDITGAHLEEARCEQPQALGNVNTLSSLAQFLPSPSSSPAQPPKRSGFDSTGHALNKSNDFDAYINGDS